ncbi:MAG: hypothetical protein WC455_15380 [Dehalococcoidia bacterium]|jgi:hypothetical protein
MWRPPDWDAKAISDKTMVDVKVELILTDHRHASEIFVEAGADAMLTALRAEGIKEERYSKSKGQLVNGYDCFIPDEEAKQ